VKDKCTTICAPNFRKESHIHQSFLFQHHDAYFDMMLDRFIEKNNGKVCPLKRGPLQRVPRSSLGWLTQLPLKPLRTPQQMLARMECLLTSVTLKLMHRIVVVP
jgi:hypothetical protein